MKKILLFLFFIFANLQPTFLQTSQQIEHSSTLYCCRELTPILATLQQLPEANLLIEKILNKGPLTIEVNHHLSKKFEGYWSGEDRTIYITESTNHAQLLTTLLFEMHNAVNDSTLYKLDHLALSHKITRDGYIEAVEKWEYENAKATSKILNKGIEKRLFPRECFWYLPDHFEEHFYTQQTTGHSAHIGKMYDQLFACG